MSCFPLFLHHREKVEQISIPKNNCLEGGSLSVRIKVLLAGGCVKPKYSKMAKSQAWRPSADERIGWDHPYIKMTGTAPGYLVQELHGYSDSYWQKYLLANKTLWVSRNRRPWIYLDLFGRANLDEQNEADTGKNC